MAAIVLLENDAPLRLDQAIWPIQTVDCSPVLLLPPAKMTWFSDSRSATPDRRPAGRLAGVDQVFVAGLYAETFVMTWCPFVSPPKVRICPFHTIVPLVMCDRGGLGSGASVDQAFVAGS